jgi:hypothetical protein
MSQTAEVVEVQPAPFGANHWNAETCDKAARALFKGHGFSGSDVYITAALGGNGAFQLVARDNDTTMSGVDTMMRSQFLDRIAKRIAEDGWDIGGSGNVTDTITAPSLRALSRAIAFVAQADNTDISAEALKNAPSRPEGAPSLGRQ